MTLPLCTLLGFALWTLAIVMAIGTYRWALIATRRAAVNGFPAHAPDGPGWYRRATRAHANCVENLPVYAALVMAVSYVGLGGFRVDALCVAVLAARVCQSVVHIAFVETSRA